MVGFELLPSCSLHVSKNWGKYQKTVGWGARGHDRQKKLADCNSFTPLNVKTSSLIFGPAVITVFPIKP